MIKALRSLHKSSVRDHGSQGSLIGLGNVVCAPPLDWDRDDGVTTAREELLQRATRRPPAGAAQRSDRGFLQTELIQKLRRDVGAPVEHVSGDGTQRAALQDDRLVELHARERCEFL